ncbi:uncharacterized protein EI97DRAFT_434636 [Westerdykella ornata]|uniref:Uncharacterized protein n=1 Tax=Westerdykella ornata TaxID=318751 RepID=A0A6A6JF81_WESOR|nr:uncharacterized protein EI97DRAFT_434636 [Westerdykella ornata]KAF2275072.1 hypothetical protein EI97DRAFT_434636 [Westerdykella ornata]
MSGAGDNRWRRSGQGAANRDRGQNPEGRSSGTSTPTREGGGNKQQQQQQQQQGGMTAVSGNVWGGGAGKVKGVGGAQGGGGGGGQVEPQQQSQQQQQQQQQQHVPVKEFNAEEVREFLKKRYLETIGDLPAVHYKVQGDSVAKRGSGVWQTRGNMSHLMPNGRDFVQELKKQLVSLEQKRAS